MKWNIFKRNKSKAIDTKQIELEKANKRSLANANFMNALPGFMKFARTTSQFETQQDLVGARHTARQYVRENAIAAKYIATLTSAVIGPNGPKISPNVMNKSGTGQDKPTTLGIKAAWERWCSLGNCSTDIRLNFKDFMELGFKSWKRDGEVLVLFITGSEADSEFKFRVKMIEADHLVETNNTTAPNGNLIRNSIEFDKHGRLVAYWVMPYHPGDYQGMSVAQGPAAERIDARDVIHLFKVERPTQTRGTPSLAPSLFAMGQLAEYEQACLQASKNAAQMALWLKANTNTLDQLDPEQHGSIGAVGGVLGDLGVLPVGYEIQDTTATHPTTTFADFRKSQLQSTSMGLNIPDMNLTGDVSAVNYSSGRLALLDFRDTARHDQIFFEEHFVLPIYKKWLEIAILCGAIKRPLNMADFDRISNIKVVWRAYDWIDPLKDSQATVLELQNGLTSLSQVAAERGIEFDELTSDIIKDKEALEKAGLTFAWMLPAINSSYEQLNQDNEEDKNEEDGKKDNKDK